MSKTKKKELSRYELLFIIPNKYTEDEAKKINEKVKNEIIIKNNGDITLTEYWGNKELAYPIKHFNSGYYNLIEFDLKGENLEKVDRALRMSGDILRHQIVRKEIKTEEQIKKEKEITEKIALKNIEKKNEEEKKEEVKKEEIKKEKESDKKMDLKDLDDKLDNLLNSDNLL